MALATKIVREMPKALVVFMLSSPDQQEDKARGRELGIKAFITKQCKPGDLVSAINKALGLPEVNSSLDGTLDQPTETAAAQGGRQLHILLVDDNSFNQKVGTVKLEKKGHVVEVAASGREALAALEKNTFDLVFMDMQMPDMDGLEATAHIRK